MRSRLASEEGSTLIETIIAGGILSVLMGGLMGLLTVSIRVTENQGHLMARTTEYAQDKLEQLMVLSFTDLQSDTRVFPAPASGGSGLTPGGSSNPAAPTALYVDYLDANGNLLASSGVLAPAGWFYKRVWAVALVGTSATLKQLTVTTTVATTLGGEIPPASTLTVLKSSPF
jgi:hypothetical protein